MVLLLIVLVASFNIVSTLIMVVTDKVREIGIMRAMGLTASDVTRVFVLQGVVIGLVGTTVGTGLGLTLSWLLDRYRFITLPGDVYFIDHLPVDTNLIDVGLIVLASLSIAFIATTPGSACPMAAPAATAVMAMVSVRRGQVAPNYPAAPQAYGTWPSNNNFSGTVAPARWRSRSRPF